MCLGYMESGTPACTFFVSPGLLSVFRGFCPAHVLFSFSHTSVVSKNDLKHITRIFRFLFCRFVIEVSPSSQCSMDSVFGAAAPDLSEDFPPFEEVSPCIGELRWWCRRTGSGEKGKLVPINNSGDGFGQLTTRNSRFHSALYLCIWHYGLIILTVGM